jgi:WD40 repeat protein
MVKQMKQFDTGLNSANCAIFDKAQENAYVACEDGTIKVFKMETGEKDGELKGHDDAVLDLTWDNAKDGYLISAGADCSFRMWQ